MKQKMHRSRVIMRNMKARHMPTPNPVLNKYQDRKWKQISLKELSHLRIGYGLVTELEID